MPKEDNFTYDIVTGKKKPKMSLLNQKEVKEEDLDNLFLSKEMLFP